jgi:FtsH-binding integral membrane protein
MLDSISSLSFPRLLTLVASLIGLALIGLYYAGVHRQGQASTGQTVTFILMGLPFLLGLLISLMPMEHRIRIVLLWLVALSAGIVAALTVFGGIGFFLLAIVITYLWAAWQENEAGQ